MLNYARSLVGKPFSNVGMARSIFFPRRTDESSFFCAGARTAMKSDRVACVTYRCSSRKRRARRLRFEKGWTDVNLKLPLGATPATYTEIVCNRRSPTSNPGAATPQSLHKLYKNQAAVTANPYTLRTFSSCPPRDHEKHRLLEFQGMLANSREVPRSIRTPATSRKRDTSPLRATFRCVSTNGAWNSYS